MMIELKKAGIPAFSQFAINVLCENEIIGECFTDILVDNKVIVELKASKCLAEEHEAQLLNYLKATNIEVGLLLNLDPRPELNVKHLIIQENSYLHLSAGVCVPNYG